MSLLGNSKITSKSLPPLKSARLSYIDRTLELMDSHEGIGNRKHFVIDGYYGDYRMKLFRQKDKN
jgi:hypothetical protein